MQTLLQDLRHGIRSIVRSPRFSLTLVIVLALGIGAATTMFTVLYGVVLRPLPFSDPDRLVVVVAPVPPEGDSLAWWAQGQIFDQLCEYRSGGVNMASGGAPARLSAAIVSASFFTVFDVTPPVGRPLTADDEKPGGENHVAIMSDRLWAASFGRDPEVIGRVINLSGVSYTVVGVAPAGFSFPGRTDLWVPRVLAGPSLDLGRDGQAALPTSLSNTMVGRLKAGVDLPQARASLRALFNRLEEEYARSNVSFGSGVQIIPLQEVTVRDFRLALQALFAGVMFLLLISCSNAVSLLLTRASARRKEIAIRLCLGASPLRVMRQLLTEAILLALISGSAGVLFAYWGVDVVRALGPHDVPRLAEVRVNTAVLGFALCTSLLVGVMVGVVPALQSLSKEFANALKGEGVVSRAGLRRHTRHAEVVFEVAVSLVLVIGAGLTLRSFQRLSEVDPGFDPKNLLTAGLVLQAATYGEQSKTANNEGQGGTEKAEGHPAIVSQSEAGGLPKTDGGSRYRVAHIHREIFEKIQGIPGVVATGGVTVLPLSSSSGTRLYVNPPGVAGDLALFASVAEDYFGAMGITVLRGRAFTRTDTEASTKVVIVNEALARVYWGEADPVGRSLVISNEPAAREIIGVVKDVKHLGLAKEADSQFYIPYLQPVGGWRPPLEMVLVVRTNVAPETIIRPLQAQIASVDKDLPLFQVRTMDEIIAGSTSAYRFRGVLMGVFALLALALAVIGVYGVVAYSVSSRTHEIGVRMSLGAEPGDILLMFVREGLLLTLVGVSLGAVVAFWLNRLIANLLFGVSPADPLTLLLSVLVLIVGALLACVVPARKASKVDPSAALRYE